MSPFKLMCKIATWGMLVAAALTLYLFITSVTSGQQAMALVVGALMLMLAWAIGFYVACLYQHRRDDAWIKKTRESIHYPARAEFEYKMEVIEEREHVTRQNRDSKVDTFA